MLGDVKFGDDRPVLGQILTSGKGNMKRSFAINETRNVPRIYSLKSFLLIVCTRRIFTRFSLIH